MTCQKDKPIDDVDILANPDCRRASGRNHCRPARQLGSDRLHNVRGLYCWPQARRTGCAACKGGNRFCSARTLGPIKHSAALSRFLSHRQLASVTVLGMKQAACRLGLVSSQFGARRIRDIGLKADNRVVCADRIHHIEPRAIERQSARIWTRLGHRR